MSVSFDFPSLSSLWRVAMTLVVGCAGGLVFWVVGFPAPWLSGSMVAVSVATLARAPTVMPRPMCNVIFVLLGISMGTGVKPDVIERIGQWPLSLAMMLLLVAAIVTVSFFYLRLLVGWSRPTAFFASIPGVLSYVLALASQSSADLRHVAVSQTTRLFVLVAILPSVLSNGTVVEASGLSRPEPSDLVILAATVVGCIACGWLASRLKVPAGWLTGAFVLSSLLNGTGLIELTIPDGGLALGYIGLGTMIGTRFEGADFRLFFSALWASAGVFLVGISISAAFSAVLAAVTGIPFGQALLAYAPGGLEVMTLLAFMLDLDPAFVATHQMVRYIAMVLLLPLAARCFLGRDWQSPT